MKRQTTLLALTVAGVLSLALFTISYQVQDMEREIRTLDRQIARDQQAIHVLKAEWSHLNDPSRLEDLAERHLDLVPVRAEQVGTFDSLPARPREGDVPETATENGGEK